MADRVTIVSPRDPWPFSTVTASDLEDLVGEGLLRPLTDEQRPEWIPPPGGVTPTPPPGYVVSFVSFHERGFGVPASRFMRAILFHYGVELHNLTPNSISQAAIFVAVCEGYLGIAPHWDLWTHLFFAELFALSTGERKVRAAVRAGGCTLLLRQSRSSQYIPAVLASSNKGWQRRWFYLRNDEELLPPFSQRVVTAATDAWHHGTPHERQKNLEPLLQALKALREGGLTAAGVVAAIHRRRVLPLAERRLPLWEMTLEADWEGSRMSPDSLSLDALQWRVSAAMGKPDPHAFSQPRMRPDQGCVTLVSVCSFLLHTSGCSWLSRLGFFPPLFRRWGGTNPPCRGSRRTRWVGRRGGSPRRRRRRRRMRRRPGPANGGGLGTPWRNVAASRRGKDSQGSRRQRHPMTMTTMVRRRRTTWPPVSALAPARGVARSRRVSPRAGRCRRFPEPGRRIPDPRGGGNPRGYLTPRPEELTRFQGAGPRYPSLGSRHPRRRRRGAVLRSP
jgi:hypothetical protein